MKPVTRHHINPMLHDWPAAAVLEPALIRGELRLAGEVLIAREHGYIVPLKVLRRVEATIQAMRG